jgi:hypothetical protein
VASNPQPPHAHALPASKAPIVPKIKPLVPPFGGKAPPIGLPVSQSSLIVNKTVYKKRGTSDSYTDSDRSYESNPTPPPHPIPAPPVQLPTMPTTLPLAPPVNSGARLVQSQMRLSLGIAGGGKANPLRKVPVLGLASCAPPTYEVGSLVCDFYFSPFMSFYVYYICRVYLYLLYIYRYVTCILYRVSPPK